MSLDKVPYIPSRTKRFDISEDEFFRERLRALLEIYNELKEAFPSIGFSLYGSLTKGKVLDEITKDSSDIDLSVYIDKDELLNRTSEDFGIMLSGLAFFPAHVLENIRDISQKIEALKLMIKLELARKLNIESWGLMGNITDIRVYPIQRTDVGFAELYEQHTLVKNVQEGGPRALSKIFRLDVGGGMKAWRRFVFDQLSAYPASDRERIWREIDTAIREHERKGNIPQKIEKQFPKTFDEAKWYYAHEV